MNETEAKEGGGVELDLRQVVANPGNVAEHHEKEVLDSFL